MTIYRIQHSQEGRYRVIRTADNGKTSTQLSLANEAELSAYFSRTVRPERLQTILTNLRRTGEAVIEDAA